MIKLLTIVLGAFFLVSVWAILKRRIKRAFKVAAVLYAAILAIRLSQVHTDQERLMSVAAVLGLFVLLWLLVWGLTCIVASRRSPNPPWHK